MKDLGNLILGILALFVVAALIGVFIALVGALFYGFGWCVGWFLHLMVGPDLVFGMAFEQFMGILFLIVGLVGTGKGAANQEDVKKKVDEGIKKGLKEYRGY
jgi:hypothetical protein